MAHRDGLYQKPVHLWCLRGPGIWDGFAVVFADRAPARVNLGTENPNDPRILLVGLVTCRFNRPKTIDRPPTNFWSVGPALEPLMLWQMEHQNSATIGLAESDSMPSWTGNSAPNEIDPVLPPHGIRPARPDVAAPTPSTFQHGNGIDEVLPLAGQSSMRSGPTLVRPGYLRCHKAQSEFIAKSTGRSHGRVPRTLDADTSTDCRCVCRSRLWLVTGGGSDRYLATCRQSGAGGRLENAGRVPGIASHENQEHRLRRVRVLAESATIPVQSSSIRRYRAG